MKESELVSKIKAGVSGLCVGTYSAYSISTERRKAPKAGQSATYVKAKHTVSCGGKPVVVSEFMPAGVKEEDCKSPFKVGDRVAVRARQYEEFNFGDMAAAFGELELVLPG